MLRREDKKKLIDELRDKFSRAKSIVMTDYKGLTVAEISDLRSRLEPSQVEFKVVKNTLARIATEDTPMSPAGSSFSGPVGIALGYDDPVAAAKLILEYAKENKKFTVTGGVIEGRLLSAEDLKVISNLPPKEVMLGMFAGAMASPLSKMAYALSATVSGLLNAMNALKEQKAQ